MSHSYYIEGCPVPFHDLPELFEYLRHSGRYLYMYQFLTVFLDGWKPLFWIIINNDDTLTRFFITYRDYPK